MPDLVALRALVTTVGAFYVRDRAMERAQKKMEQTLATGEPDATSIAAYVHAVRRYFEAFDREAKGQLKHVDRELEHLYQRQYNLTAERGVAARRVEATQGVLLSLAEIGRP